MITLTPAKLVKKEDGFYVKDKGTKEKKDLWIGHRHGETGDLHEVRISEEFYNAFKKEAERISEQYKSINKPQKTK